MAWSSQCELCTTRALTAKTRRNLLEDGHEHERETLERGVDSRGVDGLG